MTGAPTVADYMSRDLVRFTAEIEINQAVAHLLKHRISGAPVVDEAGRLLGILTAKDCFKAALHASYHQSWGGVVGEYMCREVETIDATLSLVAAAEKFLQSPYHRFPVMADGRLAGIISRSDLLRAFADQW